MMTLFLAFSIWLVAAGEPVVMQEPLPSVPNGEERLSMPDVEFLARGVKPGMTLTQVLNLFAPYRPVITDGSINGGHAFHYYFTHDLMVLVWYDAKNHVASVKVMREPSLPPEVFEQLRPRTADELRIAADEPFFPTRLNGVLPNIRPGMTTEEVKAVIKPAYPDVKEMGGEWSGKVGCIAYMLNTRYTLCVGAIIRNGKQGQGAQRQEVVADKLHFDLSDRLRKRRINVSVYEWGQKPSDKSP